jgi:hypothetical protein
MDTVELLDHIAADMQSWLPDYPGPGETQMLIPLEQVQAWAKLLRAQAKERRLVRAEQRREEPDDEWRGLRW